MKILAISKKPRKYTPQALVGTPGAPSFTVRSLTRREQLEISAMSEMNISLSSLAGKSEKEVTDTIMDQLSKKSTAEMAKFNLNGLKVSLATLEKGLLNWENLEDEGGDPLEYKLENFELLSEELMEDLVREISGRVDGEDEKKSETESPSLSGSEEKTAQASGTASTAEPKSSKESGTVEGDTKDLQA